MPLPTKESLISLMELVQSSPEGARYLQKQFIRILKEQNVFNTLPDLVQAVDEFVKNVELQATQATNPWRGEPVPSMSENLQLQVAAASTPNADVADAAAGISREAVPVEIAVEIAENSQFDRTYTSEGAPMSEAMQDHIDDYFQSWIAEHEMVRRNQTMYEATRDRNPKQSPNGELVVVPPERLKNALLEPDSGLGPYVQAMSHNELQVKAVGVRVVPELGLELQSPSVGA